MRVRVIVGMAVATAGGFNMLDIKNTFKVDGNLVYTTNYRGENEIYFSVYDVMEFSNRSVLAKSIASTLNDSPSVIHDVWMLKFKNEIDLLSTNIIEKFLSRYNINNTYWGIQIIEASRRGYFKNYNKIDLSNKFSSRSLCASFILMNDYQDVQHDKFVVQFSNHFVACVELSNILHAAFTLVLLYDYLSELKGDM